MSSRSAALNSFCPRSIARTTAIRVTTGRPARIPLSAAWVNGYPKGRAGASVGCMARLHRIRMRGNRSRSDPPPPATSTRLNNDGRGWGPWGTSGPRANLYSLWQYSSRLVRLDIWTNFFLPFSLRGVSRFKNSYCLYDPAIGTPTQMTLTACVSAIVHRHLTTSSFDRRVYGASPPSIAPEVNRSYTRHAGDDWTTRPNPPALKSPPVIPEGVQRRLERDLTYLPPILRETRGAVIILLPPFARLPCTRSLGRGLPRPKTPRETVVTKRLLGSGARAGPVPTLILHHHRPRLNSTGETGGWGMPGLRGDL
ncbi:hypothetical protein DFH09DRAFT_1098225 [Mycena vulgaris]|nr:hypothetical protein DFH09DRAFT_1098225 [Mycena vulgaris]